MAEICNRKNHIMNSTDGSSTKPKPKRIRNRPKPQQPLLPHPHPQPPAPPDPPIEEHVLLRILDQQLLGKLRDGVRSSRKKSGAGKVQVKKKAEGDAIKVDEGEEEVVMVWDGKIVRLMFDLSFFRKRRQNSKTRF